MYLLFLYISSVSGTKSQFYHKIKKNSMEITTSIILLVLVVWLTHAGIMMGYMQRLF